MNQTRGIYQPLAEKVPLYDLADEEIDEERSRVPLLIVIALLVLAAFAGVVWLAYNQGVARGRAGESIVIEPPEGPVRIAPPDAGPSTPDVGLNVYNPPVSPVQEAAQSTLAPKAPSVALTEPPPVRLSPTEPPTVSAPPPAPAQAAPPPAAAAVAPPAQPARQAAVTPPPAPRPAQPAAQARASAPASSAALTGGAVLQIGSYESEAIANSAWATFRRRHDAAGALSSDIQKADLGAKGIWYRLRVGPFADKTAAAAACAELKAAGVTCLVTVP